MVSSWRWPLELEKFVKSRMRGYSLNVCAGMTDIGDVRIDLDPKDKSIIKGDMKALPFPDETFDTVIQDPPWKISYYDRWKPFLECGRVCKVGGIVIYNATWIPWSHQFRLDEVVVRQDERYATASIISVLTRIRNTNYESPDEEQLALQLAGPLR